MNKPTLTSALLLISTTLLASACSSHQPGQDPLAHQIEHEAIAPKPTPMISEPVVASSEVTDAVEPAETDTLADVNLPDISIPDSNLADSSLADISADDETIAASLDSDSDDNARPAQTLFLFGFDEKQLAPEAELLLRQHGRFLAAHPDLKISVNGHSDAQGNPAYNQHLARQRAEYVANLLAEEGVENEQMQVMGWGADLPVTAATHNRDNRRVELIYDASLLVNYQSE